MIGLVSAFGLFAKLRLAVLPRGTGLLLGPFSDAGRGGDVGSECRVGPTHL